MKTPGVRPELGPDTESAACEERTDDIVNSQHAWRQSALRAGMRASAVLVASTAMFASSSVAEGPNQEDVASHYVVEPGPVLAPKLSTDTHQHMAAARLHIPRHANVVEIMVDDADKKLFRPAVEPNIFKLVVNRGVSLEHLRTEQSLCCTSRATSLTGEYAHGTRVVGNDYPAGGYSAFHRYDEKRALPTWLKARGYVTSFLGKYFNGYPYPPGHRKSGISDSAVPKGWKHWASPVLGDPYGGFNYGLNVDGHVDTHNRHRFITDVMSNIADKTLRRIPERKHFFMTVRPFTPHKPFSYPARFKNLYNKLHEPRTADFNEAHTSDKMPPYNHLPRLTKAEVARADRDYRDRLRGMHAVDQLFGRLHSIVKRRHELRNTYFIVTSDNGENIGEHRRLETKYDQFDQTESVPYFVSGPGIPHGKKMNILAGNVDWAPTIADMAGVAIPKSVDGVSLLPELTGHSAVNPKQAERFGMRDFMLIGRGAVPRYTKAADGLIEPPDGSVDTKGETWRRDFMGVVNNKGLKLVLYTMGGGRRWELYNENTDPREVHNLSRRFSALPKHIQRQVWQMKRVLPELMACSGVSCNISASEVPDTPLTPREERNLKGWLHAAVLEDVRERPGAS